MKKLLLICFALLLTSCSGSAYTADLENRVKELESMNQAYKDRIVQLDKALKAAGVESPPPETTPETEPAKAQNAEPAPTPSAAPTQPEPVPDSPHALQSSHSGSGDSIIQSITVSAPSLFRFQTNDDRHHDVKAYYGDGEYDYDLLVNSSDPYDGSTYLLPDRTYDIVIHCTSQWTAEIYKIGYTSDTSFSGSSDHITEIFQPETRYYKITYTGDDHFAVKQRYGTGVYDYELLVNETAPYSGTVRLSRAEDLCFFEITGEKGSWTITPEE